MRRVVLEKAAGSLGSFSAGRTASHKVSETGEETARERAAGEANRRNGGQRSATTFSDSRNVYALKDLRIYYKLLAVLGACLGQASAAVRTFTTHDSEFLRHSRSVRDAILSMAATCFFSFHKVQFLRSSVLLVSLPPLRKSCQAVIYRATRPDMGLSTSCICIRAGTRSDNGRSMQ